MSPPRLRSCPHRMLAIGTHCLRAVPRSPVDRGGVGRQGAEDQRPAAIDDGDTARTAASEASPILTFMLLNIVLARQRHEPALSVESAISHRSPIQLPLRAPRSAT